MKNILKIALLTHDNENIILLNTGGKMFLPGGEFYYSQCSIEDALNESGIELKNFRPLIDRFGEICYEDEHRK